MDLWLLEEKSGGPERSCCGRCLGREGGPMIHLCGGNVVHESAALDALAGDISSSAGGFETKCGLCMKMEGGSTD